MSKSEYSRCDQHRLGPITYLFSFIFISLSSMSPSFAECVSSKSEPKYSIEVKLGYNAGSQPFSFEESNGAPVGFTYDICKGAIGESYPGSKIINVPVTTNDQFEMLNRGEVDVLCSSITHTILRRMENDVSFSLPIFVTGAVIVFHKNEDLTNIRAFSGKRVGVLRGTTTLDGLSDALERNGLTDEVIVKEVNNHQSGIEKLRRGEIEAYVGDRALLDWRVKLYPELQYSQRLFSFEPYGIVTRSCDSVMMNNVDKYISKIMRNGRVWRLFSKYFPEKDPDTLLISNFILSGIPE